MADERLQLIRHAINQLRVADDQVVELRALHVPARYGKPATYAGYFDDFDALARAAVALDNQKAGGIYVTLNVIEPALLCRAHNRVVQHPQATTSDADVIRRVWLPFDFDPVRPSGTSASPDEIKAARLVALDAAAWLTQELGDAPTIWAFSGNGWHLLFRVDLPNDEKSTAIVKGIIEATADRFSNNTVSVDRTVFNAARIWKLYGTVGRKGDPVEKLGRVHRRARILSKGFMDDSGQSA